MSDLARGLGGRGGTRYPTTVDEWSTATGRHAFNEDAVLTPIFHALTRGGWRSRQHEPAARHVPAPAPADPVDAFQRDPLTAPIPVQALVPVPAPASVRRRRAVGAHAARETRAEPADYGRHHRRREPVGSRSGW